MLKKLFYLLTASVLSIFILYTGYSQKEVKSVGELKVYGWNSALGAISESNLDETRYSYNISLKNENSKEVYIKSIQPLVSDTIKDRILSKDISVTINKTIKPSESIPIKGEIIVDTKGMSKVDITKLEPFVTDIKVSSDEIISLRP